MNSKTIALVVIALVVGLGGGYWWGNQNTATVSNKTADMSEHDHMEHDDEKMSHDHGMFMVDQADAPTVDLVVEEDAKSGWNITVKTTDFKFMPGSVNEENVVGEGHAHLFVDGEKVARLYGPDFHYDVNFDGVKTFKVTLNANDHSEYMVGDDMISASKEVHHEHHE